MVFGTWWMRLAMGLVMAAVLCRASESAADVAPLPVDDSKCTAKLQPRGDYEECAECGGPLPEMVARCGERLSWKDGWSERCQRHRQENGKWIRDSVYCRVPVDDAGIAILPRTKAGAEPAKPASVRTGCGACEMGASGYGAWSALAAIVAIGIAVSRRRRRPRVF